MSDILTRGLDRASERLCLAVCLAVAAGYVVGFAWLLHASIRFDQVFIAHRQEVLLQRLADHRLEVGRPVTISAQTYPFPSLELLDGWSVVEEGGVWSQAATAGFAIQLPREHPATLSLELRGMIMPDPGGRQAFQLDVDGRSIGRWDLDRRPATLCATLPDAARDATGPLRITLAIGHPTQPPGGQDHRALGLFLQQVTVLPQPCAAGSGGSAP